jgi:CRP-like cAMP-binding protein
MHPRVYLADMRRKPCGRLTPLPITLRSRGLMPANDDDRFSAVIRKLDKFARLDEQDRDEIAALPFAFKTAGPHTYLVREGNEAKSCCVLLTGYACRHKMTNKGGRQIVSFHVAGDLLDLQHLLLTIADHSLETITEVTYATVPAADLKDLARRRPNIAEALWRDTLIDASIFREWVLNVGRRDAQSRIAHMLCEFVVRCESAGLGRPEQFNLPMTQEDIGDATGLTSVHVNRSLRALTELGILDHRGRSVSIRDWDQLRRVAGFDPAYLHAAA